jgi:hypothetical protein
MALSPYDDDLTTQTTDDTTVTVGPSKTYLLDVDNGRIGDFIDNEDALRQFIAKAVNTPRLRFLLYDDQYGSELPDLLGEDVTPEFLDSEIPRLITDALVYDDRIDSVSDFVVSRDGDGVYVTFTVTTTDGTLLTEGVTINGN